MNLQRYRGIVYQIHRSVVVIWAGFVQFLYERTIMLLTAMFIIGMVGILWHVSRLQSRLIESAALQGTSLYSQALAEFRSLYTSEVVVRAQTRGVEVTHDYLKKEGAIPLPATMSILLGNRIGEKGTGGQARLYSDYPFPWRKAEGGPKDDFEWQALRYLRKFPDKHFYRFEGFEGRPSLRYATADIMRPSCVNCHNTHPASPKTNWKEGDVRGVLEVIRPLDSAVAQTRAGLKETFGILGVMTLLAVSGLALVIGRLRRISSELNQRMVVLEKAKNELEKEISERKQAEELLRESEMKFRSLTQSANDAIISADCNGKIIFWNKGAEIIFGYEEAEVLGQSLSMLMPERYREAHQKGLERMRSGGESRVVGKTVQLHGLRKDGSEFPLELSLTTWKMKDVTYYTGIIRDITERKRAQEALAEQAVRDALTGLYNRRHFNDRIGEEIGRADRNGYTLALLLCDLDHFKTINDSRGHHTGDEVLKAVAQSINESTRGMDLVFRWGGDEIVVVLTDTTREGVLTAAQRIRKGIRTVSEQAKLALDLSIGVALYPEHGHDIDELIRLADRALYIAKKGGGKIHIGEEEYRLDEQAIKVVFQPIVDVGVGSDQILGYEALTRDPHGKLSVPELFKKYSSIGQLNELKQLCFRSQLKVAQAVGLHRIFVNVDFDVIGLLEPIPKPSGMEVILEISELEALHDLENHLKIAMKWRGQGYKFAIDDFGAGFISLPFIARLMPEYIKVDRSTLLHAVSSEKFKAFLKPLLQTLRAYATEGIIAEGVEQEKELQVVKEMGIYIVQGYLLGKPQELK